MQALLQKHPKVSGIILELPEVIDTIKNVNPQLESNRCRLVPGNFFDRIPSGNDAYLLKSVIHDWDDADVQKILENCHQVLRPDSRLLIVDVVLQPKDQSVYANCMDVLMLAVTGGKERSLDSFLQLLEHSGFVLQRIYPTATEFSILEAKKK